MKVLIFCGGFGTRMNNGDIIAVHAPNTTGGVVSGGGINIISNGYVSSILNGLPSGAFANDRKCWAVGSNGSSQFWVGVERACNTSGVCNYGYIAKYDNLGNHLGNIDISNSTATSAVLVLPEVNTQFTFMKTTRRWFHAHPEISM